MQLTQQESRDLQNQFSMIGHYERVTQALQLQWQAMVTEIMDRLEIPEEDREYARFDLNQGVIFIEKPEKKEVQKK